MLKWQDQKHAGTIIWIDAPMCGLEFEKAISPSVVSECARLIGTREEPIAELSNIARGRPRSPQTNLLAECDGNRFVRSTSVVLGKPQRGYKSLDPAFLSPAEEMFFWGSPLAHIVAFRDITSAQVAALDVRPGFTLFDELKGHSLQVR